jgi:hypothetical protein
MLPVHHYNAYSPISVFFQSDKGADNFKILAVASHTDDYMEEWEIDIAEEYEKIPEIRARRDY